MDKDTLIQALQELLSNNDFDEDWEDPEMDDDFELDFGGNVDDAYSSGQENGRQSLMADINRLIQEALED